jgi:hypothetical protein
VEERQRDRHDQRGAHERVQHAEHRGADEVRGALIDGKTTADLAGDIGTLVLFAIVLIPLSIATFTAAERWAKRTGRLKRQG